MLQSYQVSIIGSTGALCSNKLFNFGEALGKKLAKEEVNIFSCCSKGFGEAVFKGFQSVADRKTVSTIFSQYASRQKENTNLFSDIVIPTGMGYSCNNLLVNTADIIIAAGGGADTLSIISLAWQCDKKVLCYEGEPGWAEAVAGIILDNRKEDLLIPVCSIHEICEEIDLERTLLDFKNSI